MLSIGHPSDKVPPLPGCIDGPKALGMATHGRFDGDLSITRIDAALGNNVDLDETSFKRVSRESCIMVKHHSHDPDIFGA
jgi:hypothetical protein